MKYILSLTVFLTVSIPSFAQEPTDAPVTSIDGIIDELLDQITIEHGETMIQQQFGIYSIPRHYSPLLMLPRLKRFPLMTSSPS